MRKKQRGGGKEGGIETLLYMFGFFFKAFPTRAVTSWSSWVANCQACYRLLVNLSATVIRAGSLCCRAPNVLFA